MTTEIINSLSPELPPATTDAVKANDVHRFVYTWFTMFEHRALRPGSPGIWRPTGRSRSRSPARNRYETPNNSPNGMGNCSRTPSGTSTN